jgi:hypothetical protein
MGYRGKKVGTWGNYAKFRKFQGDLTKFALRRSPYFRNMVPMDLAQQTSASTLLTSLLSLYLLSDPPSPSCALPTIITLIAEKKPFQTIESNSTALHKWNTRVSSLLQSKSAESRFWGVCLVKASVESGGEGLGHVVVWSKLLLTLLNVCPFEGGVN